jgi:hypothetical protein
MHVCMYACVLQTFFARIPVSADGIICAALTARTSLLVRLQAYDINALAIRLLELIGIACDSVKCLSDHMAQITSCVTIINFCFGSDFSPAALHLTTDSFRAVFACLR